MNTEKLFALKAVDARIKVVAKRVKDGLSQETNKLAENMKKQGESEMKLDNDANVKFIPGSVTITREIDLKKLEKANPTLHKMLMDQYGVDKEKITKDKIEVIEDIIGDKEANEIVGEIEKEFESIMNSKASLNDKADEKEEFYGASIEMLKIRFSEVEDENIEEDELER